MVELLLVLPVLGSHSSWVTVAMAIAVGGLLSARRVAETMSHKITGMNHGQGYSAYFATGLRVMTANLFGFTCNTQGLGAGRNPKTGEAVNLPAKVAVHFKPGKEMRDRINATRTKCKIVE